MDVQGLVKAVITAFQDASKLVGRIRDQRQNTDRALPDEPTRDLLESLSLGPTIVKGQFDYEHRRWTEQYAVGDIQAREQMKDVLISLQMTLIITLRTVFMDDIEMDFDALQTASDDCRVNAGVCLGQLSQRLSDHAKAQAMYPQNQTGGYANSPGLLSPVSPGLAYSSSRSTYSSSGYSARTPRDYTDQFANMRVAEMSASTGTIRSPAPERENTTGSTGSTGSHGYVGRPMTPKSQGGSFGGLPPVGVHRASDNDGASMRRPSSHTLAPEDSELLSPGPQSPLANAYGSPLPGAEDLDRASFVSSANQSNSNPSPERSRASSAQHIPQLQTDRNSRDRYGPDDFTPVVAAGDYSYGTIYDMYRSTSQSSGAASYSARAHEQNHSTLEHIRYLQENSRPPRPNGHVPMPHPTHSPHASHFPQPPTFHPRQGSLNSNASSRKPVPVHNDSVPPPYPSTLPPLGSSNPRPSVSAPIPVETLSMHEPVMPQRAPTGSITDPARPPVPNTPPQYQYRNPATNSIASQQPSNTSTTSLPRQQQQQHPARTATLTSTLSNAPLNLPTEKSTQGYCKAAVRLFLQNGVSNKAFAAANRPFGLSGMMPYWRCEKCQFEGPMVTQVNTSDTNKKKKGKEEKVFDPKVRVSLGGGVRYKWAFLAKSHCNLRSQIDYTSRAAKEGEIGAFQCLFCCAEGESRGWTTGVGNMNGNASIRSGSTGSGAGGSAPVFGNLQMFLEHLDQTHRTETGWPGPEMLGRTKCIVGRIAAGNEEWDINLVPLDQGES